MAHNIALPRHRYVWVVPSFVLRSSHGQALVPAIWYGVSVTPGRSLGCHVLLENGAMVVDLPLHAIKSANVAWSSVPLEEVVAWDCYGWDAEVFEPSYLTGLDCAILDSDHRDTLDRGTLWFCVDHLTDGFALEPSQHKHLWIVARHRDHALMLLPQDRVVVEERSFTEVCGVPSIKRQDFVWSAE
jgi:hypothetical protein